VLAARKAVDLDPQDGDYARTLGVALYRAGSFEEALRVLTRSGAMNADDPITDVAFLAMARAAVGDHEGARSALQELEGLEASDDTNEYEKDLLREAQALVDAPTHGMEPVKQQ